MWWMVWTALAFAGEIEVVTATPVVVQVDGVILEYPEGSTAVTARDLDAGTHLVEIKNFGFKTVAAARVEVGPHEAVRFRYANKTLVEIGRSTGAGAHVESLSVRRETAASASSQSSSQHQATAVGVGVGVQATMGASGSSASSHAVSVQTSESATVTRTTVGVDGTVTTVDAAARDDARPAVIAEADLDALIGAMRAHGRSDVQLGLVRAAATEHHFTVRQVVRLLGPFAQAADRLAAVKALQPRIVDPERAALLDQAFPFQADRDKARALFR